MSLSDAGNPEMQTMPDSRRNRDLERDGQRTWRDTVLSVADHLLAPLVYCAARLIRFIRRLTFGRMPASARMIQRVNIYPLIDYPYEPLFNLDRLKAPLSDTRDLPGLVIDDNAILAMLATLGHREELLALPRRAGPDAVIQHGFHFDNPFFREGDAEILYALVRRTKPRRIIEVGCGWSSRIIALALDRNALETGTRARHVCIDPYVAMTASEVGAEHIRSTVEDCPVAWFEALEAGDILFIDSSHMIRPQGDVLFFIQRVLPRLAPGVLVEVHDIFTPADYDDRLIREHRVFWNEQYLLESFLTSNSGFEIVLPLHHLWRRYPDALFAICPHLATQPDRAPTSFWFRRRP